MQEERTMEKKTSGRQGQLSAKSGPEVRKGSDSSSTNRYNRRRESSGSKNGNGDPNRSLGKQGRVNDKRPRPRGQYYGFGNSQTKVDEAFEALDGAVAGRKKQNLNHLLNFTLTPRPAVGSGGSLAPRAVSTNWLATHKHKYNKEQFLQANCQFVVKADIDYSPYMVDPDILVDWSYIQQIRLHSSEALVCPICLDTPMAGKMTRCGHVYCWPCILHYLALSDKTWRKCPICYESVHRKDLKSVVTISDKTSKVGETFTLKLMKRERGSLLAVPVGESEGGSQSGMPYFVSDTAHATAFSKLLLADSAAVNAVTRLERAELEAALEAARGEPEMCFVEEALLLLAEREKALDEVATVSDEDKTEEKSPVTNEITKESVVAENVSSDNQEDKTFSNEDVELENVSDEEVDDMPNVAPEDVEVESQVAGQKPFYFYQAADGQNVFLTALNLKMLEAEYGSIAQSPLVISGVVLEKESGSMTRELRNRLRSLSHLPITAVFELVELELTGLVGIDVLDAFQDALRMRADKRRRRERDERRRDRQITHQLEQQWGRKPGHRIRLDSDKHFPKCGEDEMTLLEEPAENTSRANSQSSRASSPYQVLESSPRMLEDSDPHDSAGPSFAQMLKDGAKPTSWVRPAPRRVTAAPPAPTSDDEYSAPSYRNDFSDAISKALEKADISVDAGGKGKKKKKRKQVLFATGMACASK